jgi:hypothetical protein
MNVCLYNNKPKNKSFFSCEKTALSLYPFSVQKDPLLDPPLTPILKKEKNKKGVIGGLWGGAIFAFLKRGYAIFIF